MCSHHILYAESLWSRPARILNKNSSWKIVSKKNWFLKPNSAINVSSYDRCHKRKYKIVIEYWCQVVISVSYGAYSEFVPEG